MKRIGLAVLAAAGFTMAVARPVAAQNGTTLGVGVGLTLPMSDYGDKAVYGDKAGFHFGVGAGVGFYNTKISSGGQDTSKTSVGFGGGAGVRFPMSSMSLFVEARYLTQKAFDVTFARLPITVGLQFPLGGKK